MKNQVDASALSEMRNDITDDAFLGGRIKLLQPRRGYRAGIDAVLLAAAVPASAGGSSSSAGKTLLDVGAGVGTVGLCAARRIDGLSVSLLEREPRLVELAKENIDRNGLQDRAAIHLSDVTARGGDPLKCGLSPESFSIVVANPPYGTAKDGTRSDDQLKRNSNALGPNETLDHWCRFLARMCSPGGLAIMIHTVEGLPDVIAGLNGRFGSLILQPLCPRVDEEANRIIVAARKGQRGRTRLLAGIPIHADGHGFTPRIAAILRDGAGLDLPI